MIKRLSDDDRRALDVLVASGSVSRNNGASVAYAAAGDPTLRQSVDAVSRLLDLLDVLPAEEPPADLTARTLQRISAQRQRSTSGTRPGAPVAQPTRPVA